MIEATPHPQRAPMAKIRIVDGIQLPDNLYQSPRKEPGKWRYKRPDASFLHFEASTEEAVAAANALNDEFKAGATLQKPTTKQHGRLSIRRHVEDYIEQRETHEPALLQKASWTTRRQYLRQFATIFAGESVSRLTLLTIQQWWFDLTGNAQRSRRAEFRRFFNYLIGRGLCPKLEANPFSNNDSVPRVEMSSKPAKQRIRLTLDAFWSTYHLAGNEGAYFMQCAMAISLITTMRRGDICALRFDEHLVDNILRKQISKSHAQLSDRFALNGANANPANLSWDLDVHLLLRKVMQRAREQAMKNGRCPFIVNHSFKKRYSGQNRIHHAQVLPDYLSRTFAEIRDRSGYFDSVPVKARPTFHEIRALSSHLYEKAGYTTSQIQELMAHTDEKVTQHYMAGHGTNWTEISLVMPAASMSGEF